jgi:hypothetical protein
MIAYCGIGNCGKLKGMNPEQAGCCFYCERFEICKIESETCRFLDEKNKKCTKNAMVMVGGEEI